MLMENHAQGCVIRVKLPANVPAPPTLERQVDAAIYADAFSAKTENRTGDSRRRPDKLSAAIPPPGIRSLTETVGDVLTLDVKDKAHLACA